MRLSLNVAKMLQILNAEHNNPHMILGMNKIRFSGSKVLAIRSFIPEAKKITVINDANKKRYTMEKLSPEGLFEAIIKQQEFFKYTLEIEYKNGVIYNTKDPYSFEPVISEYDRYLFNKGTHYEIYNKLGAHMMEIDGTKGVLFAVWAPNAKRVSVVGDFNSWDGRVHMMRLLGDSGIFELFIPGIAEYEKYKFEIKTQQNNLLLKSDPYASFNELRPNTASVVFNTNYQWTDDKWIQEKKNKDPLKLPISIYEVHLGSWKKPLDREYLNYREIAHELVEYVKYMGYTHIELLPILEHPFDGSWGYQVSGYFSPTSRHGTPDDFKYFVNHCHENGIGVILDWVPAHFPKDNFSLIKFDGSCLYEHLDPRKGEHPHWGTLIFNVGRNEVKNFLISSALCWLEKYHLDGLRVDAVASMLYLDYGKKDQEWIPNQYGGRENTETVEFLKHMNSIIFQRNNGTMVIAEESTAWPKVSAPTNQGGLGFNLKWNMGWMNDFLKYIEKDPIYRKYHHNDLTFSMIYNYTENFILVLSHDEVVHGKRSMINKMPGDYWQKFANLRVAYGFMYGHPGKKLLFMGNDIAQFNEWSEERSIEWDLLQYEKHSGLHRYIKDLNQLYKNEKALWESDYNPSGFQWINCLDTEQSIISFLRRSNEQNDILIIICNFTPTPHHNYRIGVPVAGYYKELLNSDSEIYGGSNIGNFGGVKSEEINKDNMNHSIEISVPPLAITIFKLRTTPYIENEVVEKE